MWYKAVVLHGGKTGQSIGFPTVNLSPTIISAQTATGVYSSVVKYNEKEYRGALYYGPRLVKNETKNVLEIYILDFNKEIYGEEIRFKLGKFIRGVKNFNSLIELKRQLQKDITVVKQMRIDISEQSRT